MTIIWPGTPGESFSNDTDKILYQLICTWSNTCGTCGQYHLAIAKWWPKFHHGCNCISQPVYPGSKSRPYEDWREIVKDLEPDQQVKLVGKSNYRLIEEGVVKWEDVVTSSRVRSLQEVVSRGNLTVDQLTDAGVRRDIAERAWGAVNTPEHQVAEQTRADLVRRIQELGVQPRHLAEMFGEEMAKRIGIGAGPSGAGVMPPTSNYRSLDDWARLIVAGGIPGDLGTRLEQAQRLAETALVYSEPGQPKDWDLVLEGSLKYQQEWLGQVDLTDAERAAILAYKGTGYTRINDALRQGETPPEAPLIDAAMRPLADPVIVYRGVRSIPFDERGDDAIGTIVEEPGYQSTSISYGQARTFAGPEGAIYRITVPKGTGYVATDAVEGDQIDPAGEGELLLPRGGRLRITGFRGHFEDDDVYDAVFEDD